MKPTGKNSGEVVWEWHLWDHLIQDHDSTKANFGVVADHPELVDVNYVAPRPEPPGATKDVAKKDAPSARKDAQGKSKAELDKLKSIGYTGSAASQSQRINPDWIHTNAVDYNADLDQIVMSTPELSEIWIIDHGTTKAEAAGHTGGRRGQGGDLLYRWGNPTVYRAGGIADRRLFFQHNAHWIPKGLPGAGHILVFNNGRGRPGGDSSSVDELVLPVDENGLYTREKGKTWGPSEPVWSYSAPKKSDFFSSFISGADRLPNGDTQICSGANGTIFEVTPEKEIVWKYLNPAKGGIGGPGGPPPPPHQVSNTFQQDALALTPDQKKAVEAFQKEVDATIEKTLDAEQKKKLTQSSGGSGGFTLPGQLLSTLTLIQLKPTADQKKGARRIAESRGREARKSSHGRSKEAIQANEGRLHPRRSSGRTRRPAGAHRAVLRADRADQVDLRADQAARLRGCSTVLRGALRCSGRINTRPTFLRSRGVISSLGKPSKR